jgi:hypothetical protein
VRSRKLDLQTCDATDSSTLSDHKWQGFDIRRHIETAEFKIGDDVCSEFGARHNVFAECDKICWIKGKPSGAPPQKAVFSTLEPRNNCEVYRLREGSE